MGLRKEAPSDQVKVDAPACPDVMTSNPRVSAFSCRPPISDFAFTYTQAPATRVGSAEKIVVPRLTTMPISLTSHLCPLLPIHGHPRQPTLLLLHTRQPSFFDAPPFIPRFQTFSPLPTSNYTSLSCHPLLPGFWSFDLSLPRYLFCASQRRFNNHNDPEWPTASRSYALDPSYRLWSA